MLNQFYTLMVKFLCGMPPQQSLQPQLSSVEAKQLLSFFKFSKAFSAQSVHLSSEYDPSGMVAHEVQQSRLQRDNVQKEVSSSKAEM